MLFPCRFSYYIASLVGQYSMGNKELKPLAVAQTLTTVAISPWRDRDGFKRFVHGFTSSGTGVPGEPSHKTKPGRSLTEWPASPQVQDAQLPV